MSQNTAAPVYRQLHPLAQESDPRERDRDTGEPMIRGEEAWAPERSRSRQGGTGGSRSKKQQLDASRESDGLTPLPQREPRQRGSGGEMPLVPEAQDAGMRRRRSGSQRQIEPLPAATGGTGASDDVVMPTYATSNTALGMGGEERERDPRVGRADSRAQCVGMALGEDREQRDPRERGNYTGAGSRVVQAHPNIGLSDERERDSRGARASQGIDRRQERDREPRARNPPAVGLGAKHASTNEATGASRASRAARKQEADDGHRIAGSTGDSSHSGGQLLVGRVKKRTSVPFDPSRVQHQTGHAHQAGGGGGGHHGVSHHGPPLGAGHPGLSVVGQSSHQPVLGAGHMPPNWPDLTVDPNAALPHLPPPVFPDDCHHMFAGIGQTNANRRPVPSFSQVDDSRPDNNGGPGACPEERGRWEPPGGAPLFYGAREDMAGAPLGSPRRPHQAHQNTAW